MDPIYLDNAATTPIAPEVRAAMAPFLEAEFGNPSSRHALGVRAAEAVGRARTLIARAVGGRAQHVLFTSGGTEANNLAVLGAARARRTRGDTVVLGPSEHPSVWAAGEALEEEGLTVHTLRLDDVGDLDLEHAREVLDERVLVVSQMLVNNEFGTIYPVRALARLVRARCPHAHLHVDAVQGLGKVEVDLGELGADSLAVSAHKVHAPKGTGALVLAGERPLRPLQFGGGQQSGVRPGTENVCGIVAFGEAARLAEADLDATRAATIAARAVLLRGLEGMAGASPVEPGRERVDAVQAVELPGAPAEVWQHHLESRGVMTSVGSACQSNSEHVSPALLSLGFDIARARSVMRFSFSRYTTPEEVGSALEVLLGVAPELEALS
jgi:cysteine desulfurase